MFLIDHSMMLFCARRVYFTEAEVAGFISQISEAVEVCHAHDIVRALRQLIDFMKTDGFIYSK